MDVFDVFVDLKKHPATHPRASKLPDTTGNMPTNLPNANKNPVTVSRLLPASQQRPTLTVRLLAA